MFQMNEEKQPEQSFSSYKELSLLKTAQFSL